jgi:hypothetical protein
MWKKEEFRGEKVKNRGNLCEEYHQMCTGKDSKNHHLTMRLVMP